MIAGLVRQRFAGLVQRVRGRLAHIRVRAVQRVESEFRRFQSYSSDAGAPSLVVSLTTFPARASSVWMVIESLLDQTHRPGRIVLVLSTEEFPRRRLPRRLPSLLRRGVEVLWVEENTRSYKKYAPVRARYPKATIIVVDDDALYQSHLVEALITASAVYPGAVIGCRGRHMVQQDEVWAPYVTWPLVGATTTANVVLTGVGGTLFPPNLASDPTLTDTMTAMALAPMADDLWFWAANRSGGVMQVCLGLLTFQPLARCNSGPHLWTSNQDANDSQLRSLVHHFGDDLRTH